MVQANRFERVVVAIDAAAPNISALEIAAQFADAMSSELIGLFVESSDLLNLAALPFTREITIQSALQRKLSTKEIERDFKRAAATAQQTLAKLADERNLRWQFDVVRGHMTPELISAAKSCDLLILSEQLRSFEEKRADIGIRIVFEDVPCNATLVVGPKPSVGGGPILAIVQPGPATEQLVDLAATIATDNNQAVHIVSLSADAKELEALRTVVDNLELSLSDVMLKSVDGFNTAEISAIANAIGASVIVMCADRDEVSAQARIAAIEKLTSASILIVRP